jgi:hypothetical protein
MAKEIFKTGDIIKGKDNHFLLANEGMRKGIVKTAIGKHLMNIEIIDHEIKENIGKLVWVTNSNKYFSLLPEENETKEFKTNNLKNDMVVEYKNGWKRIYMNEKPSEENETKEFKINDLKNGMVVEYRNGWQRVYMDEKLYKLEFNKIFTHECNNISYEENLKSKTYEKLDIVKIYKDFRGELIWERDEKEKEKEIDWSKVETDTLLKVKFFEDEDECFRYFAKYENGSVYVWINGATSFTVENKYDIVEVHSAKICK